ncbi:MAG: UDP-N-acetylmuramoyl-L-alanyl-D-glutamate--2,6-diaminopimelate ligase [Patescibacteria group bacterium]
MIKNIIKKFIPQSVLGFYHKSLAIAANVLFGRPSEKIIVIGVTGTNGKSTTVSLIAKILAEAGHQVGATSTVIFKVGEHEWLNDKKMTMLGRFALQKLLKQMIDAGCQYAVIETSSEGIKQFRHLGIHYDVCVFTNLTPEHLEAHGGFANYKKAKLKLFEKLEKQKNKKSKNQKIKKTIVVNGDDKYVSEFLNFKVDEKIIFGLNNNNQLPVTSYQLLIAKDIEFKKTGIFFVVENINFDLKLFGKFNVYNALAAIAVAKSQGVSLEVCKSALEKVSGVPGRMEFIDAGQSFKILVDYAPEPESLRQLYQAIADHQLSAGGKIIHVLGSCGGGRDISRRPVLGQISAQKADIAIITNEDPYDDDPAIIIDQVASGALSGGMVLGQNLFKILDRREAIRKAISLAKPGDLVLLTGKGAEQAICVADGKKIPWDERGVVREILKISNF